MGQVHVADPPVPEPDGVLAPGQLGRNDGSGGADSTPEVFDSPVKVYLYYKQAAQRKYRGKITKAERFFEI
jgi:hypothetical protein